MSNLHSEPQKDSMTDTNTTRHDVNLLKICDEYDSDDADIQLISSDNYLFKVHSYDLQYAS